MRRFFINKQINNQLNLKTIFKKIYDLKINDILVEAGGIFLSNLLKNDLVDEIHLFKAPIIIGSSGKMKNVKHGQEIDRYDEVIRFKRAPCEGYELCSLPKIRTWNCS